MENDTVISVHLQEYQKLKDEQIQRIGFRDNIIYTTLIAVGAVGAFAVTNAGNMQALFIIPWICLVLGWTYLVNDEKISAIGKYIRYTLDERLCDLLNNADAALLGWETAHRDDERRMERKYLQLAVDELTFVASGLAAIAAYWLSQPAASPTWIWVSGLEVLLLLLLGVQTARYADLKRGK